MSDHTNLVTIYKKTRFESAHQLPGHPKCGRLHGHSYRAEVWLTGRPTGQWNFVCDFGDIADYFRQFDHSGVAITISCEEMSIQAAKHFKHINITKVVVRIWESLTSYAEAVMEGD